MKPNFDIELLPEAVDFLENLDDKTREKIYYNIKKAQLVSDNELFKKLNDSFGNFGLYTTAKHIGFFHFGINRKSRRHWL